MDIETLKRIITSQKESQQDLFKIEKIVERDLNKVKIKKLLSHPNILAILGVRRSGKSVFSFLVLENEKFGYINFFDERLRYLNADDLEKVVQAFYELYGPTDYFIFDEIQKIAGWERFVSRMRTSKRVIITGSNSDLLRGQLSTFITGRHVDIHIFPFSFREYLSVKDVTLDQNWSYSTATIASVKRSLEDYMEKGGFPEVAKYGTKFLMEIYRDIIENDIINQNKIRKSESIRNLAKYLISNAGKEITYNSLKSVIDLQNVHTVSKYVNFVENSYLIFLVERFSFKLKEQYKAPKKVYSIDTGLTKATAFEIGGNRGRIMENIVFLELLRRKSYSESNEEIFYWKDHQGREVDFVLKGNKGVKQLIQVTLASSSEGIERRETESLLRASEDLKTEELLVITWDYGGEETVNGKMIRFLPLWKWLLIEGRQN
ncbi:MAG: ATP-binding protein [Candidatus Thermoplasmatota archaeon]|nr:ATP-binding protein [Candidatus Thermoplasmatota archaeon]